MAGAERTPVEQLEQAVASVPPDVALARTAIGGVGEMLSTVAGDERAALVERTAALADRMVTAVAGQEGLLDAGNAAEEFRAHAKTFGALASVFGVKAVAQEAPTQTAGKNQSGGKR